MVVQIVLILERDALDDNHLFKDMLLFEEIFRSEEKSALKNTAVINLIILLFFKVVKVIYGLISRKQAYMKIVSNPSEEIRNILSVISSKALIPM